MFTAERWSEVQADRYMARFHEAFWALSANPLRAPTCPGLVPEYRKHTVGSHIIFFRVLDPGIEVVRILHQRMDFERHLREPG